MLLALLVLVLVRYGKALIGFVLIGYVMNGNFVNMVGLVADVLC